MTEPTKSFDAILRDLDNTNLDQMVACIISELCGAASITSAQEKGAKKFFKKMKKLMQAAGRDGNKDAFEALCSLANNKSYGPFIPKDMFVSHLLVNSWDQHEDLTTHKKTYVFDISHMQIEISLIPFCLI